MLLKDILICLPDIDECGESAGCDAATTSCQNTVGSFICKCKTGFSRSTTFKCGGKIKWDTKFCANKILHYITILNFKNQINFIFLSTTNVAYYYYYDYFNLLLLRCRRMFEQSLRHGNDYLLKQRGQLFLRMCDRIF